MRRILRVIDLSHFNTVQHLDGLRAAGIVGVIHKATQGTAWTDAKYAARRQWFIENGFAFAAYHFLTAGMADVQMKHFVDSAMPEPGERVIIDYEDKDCTLADLQAAVSWLRQHAPENPICVYGGSLLEDHIGSRSVLWLEGSSLWTAEYTARDAPKWPTGTWARWDLWQYSDGQSGGKPNTIDGVSQVDCSEFNGTDAECRAWFNAGAGAPEAINPVAAEPAPASVDERLTALEQRVSALEAR
ncbi:MAG: glycoside hydrolase family 25 protein [Pararhizobium sp.]